MLKAAQLVSAGLVIPLRESASRCVPSEKEESTGCGDKAKGKGRGTHLAKSWDTRGRAAVVTPGGEKTRLKGFSCHSDAHTSCGFRCQLTWRET